MTWQNFLPLVFNGLSRKHVCPRATKVYAFRPISTDIMKIKRLCVNADGYKRVNFYKSPPTRLRVLDIQCFLTPVSIKETSTVATLI